MQAREGYCFTQVESAVLTILALDHHFFKMEEEEYNRFLLNSKFSFLQFLDSSMKKESNTNYKTLQFISVL